MSELNKQIPNNSMETKAMEFVLNMIREGCDIKINDECIRFSDIDDQPYFHSIPEHPDIDSTVLRSETWVCERIIWLSINKPDAFLVSLNQAASQLGQEPVDLHFINQLLSENPKLRALCEQPIKKEYLGMVFAESMKAGYKLTWDANREYWSRWHWDGKHFVQEQGDTAAGSEPLVVNRNTEEKCKSFFANHYEVDKGSLVTFRQHGLQQFWYALTYIGFGTLREYTAARDLN